MNYFHYSIFTRLTLKNFIQAVYSHGRNDIYTDKAIYFIVSGMHLDISINDFISGTYDNIFPFTISHYYKKGHITFEELEKSLRGIVLDSIPSEENGSNLFDLAAVLADSSDQTLADACKDLIRANTITTGDMFAPKMCIKDFEYHGRALNWYR